ncbi:MAG: hypothetical protein ACI4SN_01930, partial [Lachnospiraceae bacterium]
RLFKACGDFSIIQLSNYRQFTSGNGNCQFIDIFLTELYTYPINVYASGCNIIRWYASRKVGEEAAWRKKKFHRP